MLTVYGALMPLRLLEEIHTGKEREKEITVTIRRLKPQLEPEYLQVLKEWEPHFAQTARDAERWIDTILGSPTPTRVTPYVQMQIEGLLNLSSRQSQTFINHLQYIEKHSTSVNQNPDVLATMAYMRGQSEVLWRSLEAFRSGTSLQLDTGSRASRTSAEPIPAGPAAESPLPSGAGRSSGSSLTDTVPRKKEVTGVFASATFFPIKQELHSTPSDSGTGQKELSEQVHLHQGRPEPTLHTATGEGAWSNILAQELKPVPAGGHTLPPLPYSYDALEPHIDAQTMRLHHDKHHQSYVDGLNRVELKLEEARQTGDYSLIKHWEREAAFHGAGHYLHTLFWQVMSPSGGGSPTGPLVAQLSSDYGSLEQFRKHFSEAADKVEGGGWAILVWSPRSHRTEILQAEKHQNLSQWDVIPLLALDVWEHAYYLKHQNNRAGYIEAWWNVVNWKYVQERYVVAKLLKWAPY